MENGFEQKDKVLEELSSNNKNIINWKIQSKQWQNRKMKKEGDFASKLMNYVYLRNQNYCWQCQTNEDPIETSILETRKHLQGSKEQPGAQELPKQEKPRFSRPKVPYEKTSDITRENVQDPFQMFDYPVPEEMVNFLTEPPPCESTMLGKQKLIFSSKQLESSCGIPRYTPPNVSRKSRERFKEIYSLMQKYKKKDYPSNRCTQTDLPFGAKPATPPQEVKQEVPVKPIRKPITVNKKSTELERQLRQLEDTALTTDITIYVCNKIFKAHRILLMAFSNYFKDIISSRSHFYNKLQVTNVSADIFEVIHKWMYTFQLDLTIDTMCELIEAGKYLQIPLLLRKIQRSIKKLLLEFGPLYMFHYCTPTEDKIVFAAIVNCISKDLSQIAKTPVFLSYTMSEISSLLTNEYVGYAKYTHIFEAVARWLAHKWQNRQYNTEKLLSNIQFDVMSDEDLFNCIRMARDLTITKTTACQDAILQHVLKHIDDPTRNLKAKTAQCIEAKRKAEFVEDMIPQVAGEEMKDPCVLKEIVLIQTKLLDFKGLVKILPPSYSFLPRSPFCEQASDIAKMKKKEDEAARLIQSWYRGYKVREKLQEQSENTPDQWVDVPLKSSKTLFIDMDKAPVCKWKPEYPGEKLPVCRIVEETPDGFKVICDKTVVCTKPIKGKKITVSHSPSKRTTENVTPVHKPTIKLRTSFPQLVTDILADRSKKMAVTQNESSQKFQIIIPKDIEDMCPEAERVDRKERFDEIARNAVDSKAEEIEQLLEEFDVSEQEKELLEEMYSPRLVEKAVGETTKQETRDNITSPSGRRRRIKMRKFFRKRKATKAGKDKESEDISEPSSNEKPSSLSELIPTEEITCTAKDCVTQPAVYLYPRSLMPGVVRTCADRQEIGHTAESPVEQKYLPETVVAEDEEYLQLLRRIQPRARRRHGTCDYPVHPKFHELPAPHELDEPIHFEEEPEKSEVEEPCRIVPRRDLPDTDVIAIMSQADSKLFKEGIQVPYPCPYIPSPSYFHLPTVASEEEVDEVICEKELEAEETRGVTVPMREPFADVRDIMHRLDVCSISTTEIDTDHPRDPCDMLHPSHLELPVVEKIKYEDDDLPDDLGEGICHKVPRDDTPCSDVAAMMHPSDYWEVSEDPCDPCKTYPKRRQLPIAPIEAKHVCDDVIELPDPCEIIPRHSGPCEDVITMLQERDIPDSTSQPCARYTRRGHLPTAIPAPCIIKPEPLPKELCMDETCKLVPREGSTEVKGMLICDLEQQEWEENVPAPCASLVDPRKRELPVLIPRRENDSIEDLVVPSESTSIKNTTVLSKSEFGRSMGELKRGSSSQFSSSNVGLFQEDIEAASEGREKAESKPSPGTKVSHLIFGHLPTGEKYSGNNTSAEKDRLSVPSNITASVSSTRASVSPALHKHVSVDSGCSGSSTKSQTSPSYKDPWATIPQGKKPVRPEKMDPWTTIPRGKKSLEPDETDLYTNVPEYKKPLEPDDMTEQNYLPKSSGIESDSETDEDFLDTEDWQTTDVLEDAPWLLDGHANNKEYPSGDAELETQEKIGSKDQIDTSKPGVPTSFHSEHRMNREAQSKDRAIPGTCSDTPVNTCGMAKDRTCYEVPRKPPESNAKMNSVFSHCSEQQIPSHDTRSAPINPVCKQIPQSALAICNAPKKELCREVRQTATNRSDPTSAALTPYSYPCLGYSEGQLTTSKQVARCKEATTICSDIPRTGFCKTESVESDPCTREKADLQNSIAVKRATFKTDPVGVEAPKPAATSNAFTNFLSKFIPKHSTKFKSCDEEARQIPDKVTVVVGCKKFQLKRCKLCEVSNWVKKKLGQSMDAVECITVPNIPEDVFELLTDWICSGELNVTLDNLSDLMHAAQFLEMPNLYAYICQSIADMIYLVGPLHMMCFAETINNKGLRKEIIGIISNNLKTISQKTSFHSYSPKELSTLLNHCDLEFKCKSTVVQAVIRWLAFDWDKRCRYAVELLCLGGLHSLSAEEITACIKFTSNRSEPIKTVCRERILEILYCENTSKQNGSNCNETPKTICSEDGEQPPSDESTPPPSPRRAELLIIGGIDTCMSAQAYKEAGRLGVTILTYSARENRWASFEQLPAARHHAAAALLHGTLYITGGSSQFTEDFVEATNTVWCFDYLGNRGWSVKAPMHHARVYHALVSINGLMYAVGGMDKSKQVLRSIECYDPAANKWTEVACLQYPRMAMATICFHKTLLICGGLGVDPANSRSVLLRTCEMYVPESKQVIRIRPLRIPRCFSSLACFNHKLHLVGGATIATECQEASLASIADVDYWDEETKQWIMWTCLRIPRQDLITAVIGPRLYVVGGHNAEQHLCLLSVECYDLGSECWIQGIASLPLSLSGSACAVVENMNARPVTIVSTAAV